MFVTRLKQARAAAGLTQKEFAAKLFLSQQAYAKYETGTSTPNPETLKKISDILNVSVDYLLGKETVPSWLKGAIDEETAKTNDTLADIVLDLSLNSVLFNITNNLRALSDEQLKAVEMFLSAFQQQQIDEVE